MSNPHCVSGAPLKSAPDVSVVLAVRNVEDVVGQVVRGLAARLRADGKTFEIIAVNDGCYDTSFAVLALLASDVPGLRLLPRLTGDSAFLRGVREAEGAAVMMMEVGRVAPPLAAMSWMLGRLAQGRHAVVVRGRCIAARKLPALPALIRARGRGDAFERSFERAAFHLDVEIVGAARPRSFAGDLLQPVLRLLAA